MKSKLAIFFLVFIILSILIQSIIISQESFIHGNKILGVVLMWIPGISALITLIAKKESLFSIGWKLNSFKYYLISYSLPIIYYGLPFLAFVVTEQVVLMSQNLSLNILLMLSIIPLINVVGALGEEIGWRGFLLPVLFQKYSYINVSIIIGIIWSIWHFPLIIFTDMYADSNIIIVLITFSLYTISITFAYNWLWLKSKSIWTVSLLHGVNNSIALNFNSIIEQKSDLFTILNGDAGIITPILCILIALFFLAKYNKSNIRT